MNPEYTDLKFNSSTNSKHITQIVYNNKEIIISKANQHGFRWFILSIIFGIFQLIIKVFSLAEKLIKYKILYFLIEIIRLNIFILYFCSISAISLYVFSYGFKHYIAKKETSYSFILSKHLLNISYLCAVVILQFINNFIDLELKIIEKIHLSILYVLIYYISIRIVIDATGFKIFMCNYKNIIEINQKNNELIGFLNNYTKIENRKISVDEIFYNLSKNKEKIEGNDIIDILKDKSILFFELFDLDADESVSKKEFTEIYNGILNEKNNLDKKLNFSNQAIAKLEKILFVCFLPFIILAVISTINISNIKKETFTSKLEFFISLNFIFAGFLSDFFQNTFFVIFARPFEVDDIINIDNKRLKVVDIGLLYSTFEHDSVKISLNNTVLRNLKIENFRDATQKTEYYDFFINYEIFYRQKTYINNEIYKFIKTYKRYYLCNYELFDYHINVDGNISMKIRLVTKIPHYVYLNMEGAKDRFTIFLKQLKDSVEIKNKEKLKK